MRLLVIAVLGVLACNKHDPAPEVEPANREAPAVDPTIAAVPAQKPLALDHVTLLYPEAVLAKRLPSVDSLTALLKQVTTAITSATAALPAELDAIVVARKGGVRVWLVGAQGDLAVPESLTKLAPIPIVDGNIAAVVTLFRPGTSAATRDTYMPAAWKHAAAAAKGGMDIDHVIDAVWPR